MRTCAPLTLASLALSALAAPLVAQVQSAGVPQPANPPQAAAIVTNLKMQLRNLVSAQESYFADNTTYTNSLKLLGYVARDGAFIMVFRADKRGWAGRAVHPDFPGKSCVIWVGPSAEAAQTKTDATQVSGTEGEPVCDAP